ncbi:LxmA leader domain family RiPP [Crossiella sp. SN42]|uniref:LxmA leader domain family RiPP n=1 Tax=Crossiella sp. SN42 TaxID=2944808 RepID=UPI00207C8D14|nr:LxmA leader domain family RiPP [Crossiella sp. SN42]MCO1580505.1 LxmA leader domain family RiPP [Crossiella sp. SN42]
MAIEEMVAGYSAYVDVAELDLAAMTEAPATTPACFMASFTISYQVSKDIFS